MDSNTYGDENDEGRSDSYWRRRVIALVAGLSLVGVLAWAFSGGGGKPGYPVVNTSAGSGNQSPVALTGVPSPTRTSPSGAGTPKGTTRASAAVPTPAASAAALGRGTRTGGSCSPEAVVLTLFTSRPDYGAGQDPAFAVDAVSTASGACAFDTSPKKLYVVVMSSGRVIWDSADCAHGSADRVAALRRGVPAQESVQWNRTLSLPGCVTLASAVRPGTYQVQARTASTASPVRTFKLER